MSRQTVYHDSRLSVITGIDHAIGQFFQVYDKEMESETPDGEGLVLDWSELFGFETNLTGICPKLGVQAIIFQYIEEHGDEDIN